MQLCPNFSLQASALRPARIKAYNRTIVKQSILDFEQFYPNSEAAQNPTVERRRAACGRRSSRQGDHLPSAPVRPAAKNNPDRPPHVSWRNCNKPEAYRAADTQDRPIASRRRPCHARHSTPTNGPPINKSSRFHIFFGPSTTSRTVNSIAGSPGSTQRNQRSREFGPAVRGMNASLHFQR
jgi:hypothetical protein